MNQSMNRLDFNNEETPLITNSTAFTDSSDGYSIASTVTNQVTGAINSRSPLQEGFTDVLTPRCCCQCGKPSCKWCSLLIMWIIYIVAQMMVIIIVYSMLIDNYRMTATHSKYLLLPSHSAYKLPIDTTRYGSVEFLYTDNDYDNSEISYIITANSDSDRKESVQYTRDNYECNLPNYARPFDCIIIRHWPMFYEPDNNSYIQCDSNGKSFLVWKWFPFKVYNNPDINDYNISCRDQLPHVLECDNDNNNKLHVNKILNNRKHDDDGIVVMKFCTQEDNGDYIQYTAVFNEHRPVFNPPYNQLIMGYCDMGYCDMDSSIIPLKEYDHVIVIVDKTSYDGEPVEIEVQHIAKLDQLLQNEAIAYKGCTVVIAIIVLGVVLYPLLITIHFKTKESDWSIFVFMATSWILLICNILVLNSMLIYYFNTTPSTISKYLLLPSNGNWELSQDKYTLLDSDKYNAMEFSFITSNAETNITFILGSIDYEMSSYTRENILCSTTRDSSYISDDCIIVKYWPYKNGDGNANSYIQCQSNVNGQNDGSFLVWK